MCIAIEPMITLGSRPIVMERDGWPVRTRDRKCAAHFEHTVAVGAGEADILSSFKFIEEVLGFKFGLQDFDDLLCLFQLQVGTRGDLLYGQFQHALGRVAADVLSLIHLLSIAG